MYNFTLIAAEAAAEGITITYGALKLMIAAAVLLLAVFVFLVVLCIRHREIFSFRSKTANTSKESLTITDIDVGKLHEQGRREYQQDSFGVSDNSLLKRHGLLAIVADGMGGLSAGDEISIRIVEEILDSFIACPDNIPSAQLLLFLAKQAVQKINAYLGEENFRTSGSTLVMGHIRDNMLTFLSIGDSRISLLRDGKLYHLNREHVYKNELAVRAINDVISLQEVYTDPSGGGLTSYIGMGEIAHIDCPASPIRLYPGDKIMLMSDGVYNAVEEAEMVSALSASPADAANALRTAIEQKAFSNQDNYTCIVLECKAAEKKPAKAKKQVSKTIIPS